MAERKSKRKAPPKVDEDAEPEGLRKLTQNPIIILLIFALIVAGLVGLIFAISKWLSGA